MRLNTLHQDHNLPRQYAFNGNYPKGAFNGSEYSNLSITQVGFPIKHQREPRIDFGIFKFGS